MKKLIVYNTLEQHSDCNCASQQDEYVQLHGQCEPCDKL